MKKLFVFGAILLSAPFISSAQVGTTGTTAVTASTTTVVATTVAAIATTTVTVDPGLVPGDFFYFLDIFGEKINTLLAFNQEKKARLHLEYAKERVAEIKDVLKNPNAKIQDVASAKANLTTQIANATTIVKSQKEKGVDVAILASDLSAEVDDSNTEMKNVLREHKNANVRAEAEIRAKIQEVASTNPEQVQGLTKALEAVTKERDDTSVEEEDMDTNISENQAVLEQVMGTERSAKKHVEKAMKLNKEIVELRWQVSAKETEQLKKQTEQAQEAMGRGDFETANRISNEAVRKVERMRAERDNEEMPVGVSATGAVATPRLEASEQNTVKQGDRDIEVSGKVKVDNDESDTDR